MRVRALKAWAHAFALRSHDPRWGPCDSSAIFARFKALAIEIHGHGRAIEKTSIIKNGHVDHAEQVVTIAPGGSDPNTTAIANMEVGDVEAEAIWLRRVCRNIDAQTPIRIGNRHRAMALAKAATIFSRHEAVRIAIRDELQLQATTVAPTFKGSHRCKSLVGGLL